MTTEVKTNNVNVKKQKGYSLVELGIVIAVIAIFIGGVVTFGQGMFKDTEVKTEQQNIQAAADNIKKLYEGTNYSGFDNTVAQNAKVFSDRLVDNGYNNVWNGLVSATAADVNSVANSGYAITYTEVPQDVCPDFVAGVQGKFDVITIGSTEVKSFNGKLDRAATAAQCASATTVDIIFTAR